MRKIIILIILAITFFNANAQETPPPVTRMKQMSTSTFYLNPTDSAIWQYGGITLGWRHIGRYKDVVKNRVYTDSLFALTVKKAHVDSLYLNTVHKTGSETINGQKIWMNDAYFNGYTAYNGGVIYSQFVNFAGSNVGIRYGTPLAFYNSAGTYNYIITNDGSGLKFNVANGRGIKFIDNNIKDELGNYFLKAPTNYVPANDDYVVHKTGNEDIFGLKNIEAAAVTKGLVVGEGIATPDSGFLVHIKSNVFGNNRISTHSNIATNSSAWNFSKTRGTEDSMSPLLNGDRIMVISWGGADGATSQAGGVINGGRIVSEATADWSGSNHSTKLFFEVNGNNTNNSNSYYRTLTLNGQFAGFGTDAPTSPIHVFRQWAPSGPTIGAGVGMFVDTRQSSSSDLLGGRISAISTSSGNTTGLDIISNRGTNANSAVAKGVTITTNTGARIGSSVALQHFGIQSILNGSSATSSTQSNVTYTNGYFETNSVTAVGESSIVEGVRGKATGLSGMTTKGGVFEATGGTNNYAIDILTGDLRISPLTASTSLGLDANKKVISIANNGTGNNVLSTSPVLTTPQIKTYTVATLPTGQPVGTIAIVTDAVSPTYLGALTGGGAVVTPVVRNATAWVSF